MKSIIKNILKQFMKQTFFSDNKNENVNTVNSKNLIHDSVLKFFVAEKFTRMFWLEWCHSSHNLFWIRSSKVHSIILHFWNISFMYKEKNICKISKKFFEQYLNSTQSSKILYSLHLSYFIGVLYKICLCSLFRD